MIVDGAWERCPYTHPEGWGRCKLLDASAPHRNADGELRHLCDPETGTRAYKARDGGKRMSGETRLRRRPGFVTAAVSKRDQSRWARKEEGQPLCPRVSPRSGVRCHLIDNAGLHENGHEGRVLDTGSQTSWATDDEDVARWHNALARGVAVTWTLGEHRPGTPMPPLEPEHYPRPPGWEDRPGDYAFSFTPPSRRGGRDWTEPYSVVEESVAHRAWDAARQRALEAIASYHRRPVGNPTMFVASPRQWLLWFRTEEDVHAPA